MALWKPLMMTAVAVTTLVQESSLVQQPSRGVGFRPAVAESPQVPRRGGGVTMRLDDTHAVYSVARIGPDGKVKVFHVTGEEEAKALVHASTGGGQSNEK